MIEKLKRGFEVTSIKSDFARALLNLTTAAKSGYRPPTKREGAYMASVIASVMCELEAGEPGLVRHGDQLLALRPELPEVYSLGAAG